MGFDDDYKELDDQQNQQKKLKVSTQKSIFDKPVKKPTQKSLENKVKSLESREIDYKERTHMLALQFKKMIEDKTLPQNKGVFAVEGELEILSKIAQLASEINNDEDEEDGIGSLTWIVQLLKTCLSQRDRINKLEFALIQIEKNNVNLKDLVKQEVLQALDSSKNSE